MAPSNVHRPLPQSWSSPSPQTVANYNGTLQKHHVHSSKVGRQPPSPPPQTIAHYNGTLQWHHVHSQRWSSPSPQTIAHCTLQWHHVHTSKVGRHPRPHHSTLQWHPAMAPSNGTTSTPPKLVVTLPPNHSTLQWHPTMAQQWHRVLWPCNGTLVPRPIRQSGSSPSPPIGSKNPYSYRYLGKKKEATPKSAHQLWIDTFRYHW